MIGDRASEMAAIPDLANLYQIELEAIERHGLPPLVFPRASLAFNTL
jgi:hypothetical protein